MEDPDGKPLLQPGEEPVLDSESPPGTYATHAVLRRSGAYRVTVEPSSREGGDRAEKEIDAKFATKEDQDTVPDHVGLRELVKAANPPGQADRTVRLWELPHVLDALPPRTTDRVTDQREVQLWDTGTPLLLVTLLLGLEWLWRKRYQLI